MCSSTADGDPEVVVGLVVEDASVPERTDEHHGKGEADRADPFPEENGSGLDADLHVIATVLAGVDGVYWSIEKRRNIEGCEGKEIWMSQQSS